MATSERFLDNILHFLAPYNDLPAISSLRKDGIIQTRNGRCFAVAYSRKSHAIALIWAPHPHHLTGVSGTDCVKDAARRNPLWLVSMETAAYDRDRRWPGMADCGPESVCLDLSWLDHKVPRTALKLSRASLRESVLYRIGHDTSVSAFVAFQAMAAEGDEARKRLRVLSKLDRNYCVPELEPLIDPSPKGGKEEFRSYATRLVSRGLSDSFMLRVKGADGKYYSDFPADEISRVVTANFAAYIREIASGRDPVRWRDHPVTPLLRFEAALAERLKELKPSSEEFSWSELARNWIKFGYHFWVEEKWDFLRNTVVDFAAEKVGLGAPLTCVPHNWQKLIRRPPHHLFKVDSDLHRLLHPINPEECGDLEWVRFDGGSGHAVHFSGRTELADPDPAATFKDWAIGLLLAPFGPTFVFRDRQGVAIDPITDLDQTRVLQVQNEMMQLYLDTHGRKLYAYFSAPEFNLASWKLPVDAPGYLKAGQVIMVDFMKADCPMSFLPFDEFLGRMREIGTGAMDFPEPEQPGDAYLDLPEPEPQPPPPPAPDDSPSFVPFF